MLGQPLIICRLPLAIEHTLHQAQELKKHLVQFFVVLTHKSSQCQPIIRRDLAQLLHQFRPALLRFHQLARLLIIFQDGIDQALLRQKHLGLQQITLAFLRRQAGQQTVGQITDQLLLIQVGPAHVHRRVNKGQL